MKKSLLALKILIWFYTLLLIGVLVFAFTSNQMNFEINVFIFMAVFISISFASFFYIVRLKLMEKKYWAWVASVIIFGLFVLSAFFPIGIYGLIGALSKETRQEFAKLDLVKAAQI